MLRVTAHLVAGPKCIYAPAVVPVGGSEVYVFGDPLPWDCREFGEMEVFVFNTVSLRWRTLPCVTLTQRGGERPPEAPPSPRIFHTAVLIDRVVYIYGGCTKFVPHGGLHAFDMDAHSWSKPAVSGSVPQARGSHSACVSEKVMYVFGGYSTDDRVTRDVFKLDTSTMVWCFVSARGTPPRAVHNCTAFIGTKMFVFGGCPPESHSGMEDHGDSLSVFDIETNVWLRTPPARLYPVDVCPTTSISFAHDGELYVFKSDSMWKYTPATSSWKKTEPKGKTVCWEGVEGMSMCAVGDEFVLFGGRSHAVDHAEVYVLAFNPSLKTLCKLAVIQDGLEQSELPHDIRWELTNMTT